MMLKITTYHGADFSSTLDLNNLFVQAGRYTVTVAIQVDAKTSLMARLGGNFSFSPARVLAA